MDEPLLPTTNTNQVDSITLNMKDQPPIYVIAPHFTATHLSRQAKSMVRRGSFEVLPSDLHLDKKLGEGQFGVVFKGTFNGKPCAVKMLKDGVTKGMEYERLLLELSILAGVGKHPNLVCFLGACFQEDKTPMIVEEFVEGPDLEEYLHFKQFEFNLGQPTVWSNFAFLHYPDPHLRIVFEYTDPGSPNPQPSFDAKISPPAPTLTPWTRCFAAPQVQLWALDILSALEHLHALDPVVIHRDLKPANILLTRDRPRRLKLADFGLAKRFSRAELLAPSQCHAHTYKIGTPRYAAPEVFHSPCVDEDGLTAAVYTEKADVYSAALIIYHLLSGRRPKGSVQADPLARPPIEPAQRRWPELAALLQRMWEEEAGGRPGAGECAAAVRDMTARPALCGMAGDPGCMVQ